MTKTVFVLTFLFSVGASFGAWYYPQMDLELYRLDYMREESRRTGMYAAHPGTLPPVSGSATFRIRLPKGQKPEYSTAQIASEKYDEKSGCFYVTVGGGYLGVGALRSPMKGWEAKTFDGSWRAAAVYPDSELPPHLMRLSEDRDYKDLRKVGGHYDTQKEFLAYIECEAAESPELFVGESIPEMLNEDVRTFEYDPAMKEVADGHWRTLNALAMRYFRFKDDRAKNVKVVPVWRDLQEKGVFRSGQPRFDKMRDVGVHTLRLCANDFLIDGLKRDRLPWGGDLTVSLLADAHVYGDAEIARRSLSILDAYTGDVNGIVTYSMWTVISHDLYQLYFGDGQFLKDRWWRIKWRVDNLVSRCDADGFVAKGLDWVFIDWAGPNSKTALNVIWAGALDAAARLAERVDDASAEDYRALRDKVKANLNRLAWDEKRGLYRVNPADKDSGFARQANIYAVLFNVADAARAARIGDELAKDELEPVGTPYVYGWELVALARTGHPKEFFAGLEKVFGAMLDAGATSYWEGFNVRQKDNEKYSFYGRPWGKSLCHVWSAWPAFIFISEAMGVRPTSDGWKTFEAKAIPGSEGFKAEIPIPCGVLKAEVTDALEVKTEVKPFCSPASDLSAEKRCAPKDRSYEPAILTTPWGQRVVPDEYLGQDLATWRKLRPDDVWPDRASVWWKDPAIADAKVVQDCPWRAAERLYVLGKAGDGTPVYLFDTGAGLLLIDSGGSDWGPMLEQEIRLTGRDPRQVKWLALTHWHDDHSAGAPYWKKKGVEIWAPEDDAGKLRADKIPVDRTFRDGDVLVFGGVTLRAIATPGHTRGSACFYCEWEGKKILFGEDIALHAGRNAWMGGKDSNYDQYLASLEKLCDYRVEGRTVVFDMLLPGHGAIDLEQGMKSVIAARDIVRDMVARRKAGEKIAGVDIYKWQWEHRRRNGER